MTMSASFSHRAIASWHPYFRLQCASFSGRAIYRNRVHWQQTHIVPSTFFYVEQKLRWVICMFLSAANVESDIFFSLSSVTRDLSGRLHGHTPCTAASWHPVVMIVKSSFGKKTVDRGKNCMNMQTMILQVLLLLLHAISLINFTFKHCCLWW